MVYDDNDMLEWDAESLSAYAVEVVQANVSHWTDEDGDERWVLWARLRNKDGSKTLRHLAVELTVTDETGQPLGSGEESVRPGRFKLHGLMTSQPSVYLDRHRNATVSHVYAVVKPGAPNSAERPHVVPTNTDDRAFDALGTRFDSVRATCVAKEWFGGIETKVAIRVATDNEITHAIDVIALDDQGLPVGTTSAFRQFIGDPNEEGVYIAEITFDVSAVPARLVIAPNEVELI